MKVLVACLLVSLAMGVKGQHKLFDDQENELAKLQLRGREAKTFIRTKRFVTSLYEECREGCSWGEVMETKGSGEASHEWMRQWKCEYRTKCPSDHYCRTTGNDYSRASTLLQECWRDAGLCGWGKWGGWGTCNSTCTPGTPGTQGSSRTRSCSCPSAVGGGAATCSGSKFSSRSQACSLAGCSCGNPGTPANSLKFSGANYLYQDVVTYSCVTGYYVTAGNKTRTCDVNTLWTGTAPTCSREL